MPEHSWGPQPSPGRGGTLSGGNGPATVAYFSMEVAIDDRIPTYSGGLGVLAGDHLRSAADLGVPLVAVTLLYRRGFFRQRLDADGHQSEEPVRWDPAAELEPLEARVEVTLEGRRVGVTAWCRRLTGVRGHEVPVYFLDTDLPENEAPDRDITGSLYGGDLAYRLRQEAVLGLGGRAMLAALGHDEIEVVHMNEGHAALLVLAERVQATAANSVFTTHTPVPAGHDRFDLDLVTRVLGPAARDTVEELGAVEGGALNMTLLGMSGAGFINGVSHRHGEVSRQMFPNFAIESITNGVHAGTWVGPNVGRLLDEALPGWRVDGSRLRAAATLDLEALRRAHHQAKRELIEEIATRTDVVLDPGALTIAVARRATAYKRTDLLLSDPDRLRSIAERHGGLQIVFSGKAHPADEDGKELIERIVSTGRGLAGSLPVVYLEEYSMSLAKLLCAGVDIWLNTPRKPLEASGTSGMKAALNAVPSLSVLDGWWIEGHIEGVTGWSIGDDGLESDSPTEAEDLYRKLDGVIAPLFYEAPLAFAAVMRSALAVNGSFFNAERMVAEYVHLAYEPLGRTAHRELAPV